jgi:hypothetical protein
MQGPLAFTDVPVSIQKKRARGKNLNLQHLVHPTNRRLTRSSLKLDGYKAQPLEVDTPTPKKKPRAKFPLVNQDPKENVYLAPQTMGAQKQQEDSENSENMSIPATPIHVLQRVGLQLGIDPTKLSKEKLEADPSTQSPEVKDD